MSKRSSEQITRGPPSPVATTVAAAEEQPTAVSVAAAGSSAATSFSPVTSAVVPLPEQSLGRKRARHSPRTFQWISTRVFEKWLTLWSFAHFARFCFSFSMQFNCFQVVSAFDELLHCNRCAFVMELYNLD
jgi:hypothetical protein